MILTGVDPGNTCGVAVFDVHNGVVRDGANEHISEVIARPLHNVVIERMTPRVTVGRDMLAGAEMFGAVVASAGGHVYALYRQQVCAILTGSARAKKPAVKEAVLSILGDKPKKGASATRWTDLGARAITGHAWDALALCVAFYASNETERASFRFRPEQWSIT